MALPIESPRFLAPLPAAPEPEGPLVALQLAPAKAVWRKRQHDPAEEVELAGSCGSRTQLRSLASNDGPQPAAIEFVNQSAHKVR